MPTKMTPQERQATLALSSIMCFRMIGLFMVIPVFSLYARQLPGSTPFLIGLAIGIYGLFQAIFQIPFGTLSDHFGRKPIIALGLSLFVLGSLLAGVTTNFYCLILGRALQGVGAIGSTTLALIADFTREEQRTKAMAIAGISIGFSFSLAMIIGPVLSSWILVNHLFLLSALFGLFAISILYTAVPTPKKISRYAAAESKITTLLKLLLNPALAKLNIGIFILHAIFTASFVVIPISLLHYMQLNIHEQWKLYLPTLLIALFLSLAGIGLAERKHQVKPYFLAAIITLLVAEICFWLSSAYHLLLLLGLGLFFTGFSLLEAFLPSLVSRTAPPVHKGSALGIYSFAQFFGIFTGGVLGGWLYGKFNLSSVYLLCILLIFFWLLLANSMRPPRTSLMPVKEQ